MKQLYMWTLCLFVVTSCKPRLITQGIKDKTSTYVVTTDGKQIDGPPVTVQKSGGLIIDAANPPLANLSAIKQGEAYYGVKNGRLYDGVYYGKLMLLRRETGTAISYTSSGRSTTSRPVYSYYLQHKGQAAIVDLTGQNLVDFTQDNPLANRKAKAARIYSTVTVVSCITAIAGLACVFLPYENGLRRPAVTLGLVSMPVFLVSMPIANHKKFNAIKIYNR